MECNTISSLHLNDIRNGQNFLILPSKLNCFANHQTDLIPTRDGRSKFVFQGHVYGLKDDNRVCPHCQISRYIHQERTITLNHIPFGENPSEVNIDYVRLQCPKCNATKSQPIPFKSSGFRLTTQLYGYICLLLADGLSLKAISKLVGISADTVRRIDKERMQNLYEDETGKLKIPKQATILNIDELLLYQWSGKCIRADA